MLSTIAVHTLIFAAAFLGSFALRFDFSLPDWAIVACRDGLFWVLGCKLLVFAATGQYRSWWGHVTFADLTSLGLSSAYSLACLGLLSWTGVALAEVPRSVLMLDFVATVMLLGGLRSLWRMSRESVIPWRDQETCGRALLVGADHSEKVLALYLHSQPDLPYRICGFLDDGKTPNRHFVGRVPVLGSMAEMHDIAARNAINEIIVIAGTLPGVELRRLREQCDAAQLKLRILPPLPELVRADNYIPVREVDVNTLLRRDPVQLDLMGVGRVVKDTVVMVTGAGGSIGSEICRQLLQCGPRRLVLVERSEPSLFQIDCELRRLELDSEVVASLGDVADTARMRRLFELHRPHIVFHVAAHKHVPLLEDHPGEAIKNNLFGTANLVELANEFEIDRFVLVSTDKAVKPSSVMGVSKRLCENYVHAMAGESATRFLVVRFGNVLGSVGSVVPMFQDQIRRGGPLTITHPAMERYFMTIGEAAHLVLQAASLGKGGETFVLDMGEPVRIVDLARDLVSRSGLREGSIDIVHCGMRPGEKLNEQLYFDDERRVATQHPKISAAAPRLVSLAMMREWADDLRLLVDHDEAQLMAKLREFVPEYSPWTSESTEPVEATPVAIDLVAPAAGIAASINFSTQPAPAVS